MAALGIMPIPSRDQFHSNPQHLPYHDYSSVRSTTNPNLQSSHNSNSVQSSTSTSVDESRPSLPSISNLLDIASDNTNTDQARAAPTRSPELHSTSRNSRPDQPQAYRTSWPENHLQSAALDPAGHSRSPSIKNVQYSINNPTQNGMLMSPTYRPEAEQRALAGPSAARYQPNVSPYDAASSTRSYATSPGAMSDGSSYSPIATMNQRPPYAAQMPLGYGPSAHALASQSTPNLPATNPWEHHHYIINSSNSQGGFPPMPDRYICPTCNKAFSRPSSLKIHSHSHTGEKPFKCPHAGCGKAFSVKSNMKRHEKGCHGGGDQADEGADMIEE